MIEGRWGGKYLFQCFEPNLEGFYAYVDVEIEEAPKDWHFEVQATKIPKGAFKGSAVAGKSSELNKNYAVLDSEDLDWADKRNNSEKNSGKFGLQVGATHEFGHMIGLGDEYPDKKPGITHATLVKNMLGKTISEGRTNEIMSIGDHIGQQHYVTFLEALKK
ncbi:MAG: hypothetical protein HC880_20645 [Bacteroidia bacterium]|nr:hypothetical protein [Bacteroidia bacterium]